MTEIKGWHVFAVFAFTWAHFGSVIYEEKMNEKVFHIFVRFWSLLTVLVF